MMTSNQPTRRQVVAGAAGIAAAVGAAPAAAFTPARQAPKDFLWGTAISAHQSEGGNTASDSWLLETNHPTAFTDPSGDACDSYHRYEEDLDIAKDLGLNCYRLGIEWARIEPAEGQFSEAALDHYARVLKACHARGLLPMVTYNHFTVPLWFAMRGGFEVADGADLFARFCGRATERLGPLIGMATTFNEANILGLRKWHGATEVVTGSAPARISYAALRTRANRLSGAFFELGLREGDHLATLGWNTQAHMECWYAAMGIGIVCHTLNPRLTADHLAKMIQSARNRVLVVSGGLAPLVQELVPLCPTIEHVVLLDDGPATDAVPTIERAAFWHLADLLADKGKPVEWGRVDENAPAGLCFTSGTTGDPKGVTYTHRSPDTPFAQTEAPPAPDYSQKAAWFAFPGANGLERSAPPGFAAIDERAAPADVFFIHPTMYLKNDVWNAPFDVEGAYNSPVLLAQLSAFNGCCLLYAPHYRQASLAGLRDGDAVALAYADVARAFRYYVEHHNRNRPFIIASHSQGTGHAVRLLQEAVIGTPLQERLVAAYTIGAYAPSNFASLGLPICGDARQTGCVLSWNASQLGRSAASILTKDVDFWWQGKRIKSRAPAICVNPLTWDESGSASASSNQGSLSFPEAPYPAEPTRLAALQPHLTGAQCSGDGLLQVDIGWRSPFRDGLSWLYGSYHRNDYGLFYANVRANAIDRVTSWQALHEN